MQKGWTQLVLAALSKRAATCAQLRALPALKRMHAQHLAERAKHTTLANFVNPVNSMVYDTLYRLRRQGKVVRESDGMYHLTENVCSKCGENFATHNDDGSCVED